MWSEAVHRDNIPNYFKICGTKPTNNDELNAARNTYKLKYAMVGDKIWNFASQFQLELIDWDA